MKRRVLEVNLGLLNQSDILLVVVDVQERFRNKVFQFDLVVKNVRKLVEGFKLLGIPIVVTEQYPQGLGSTVPELKESLGVFTPIEKTCFSCFDSENFVKQIEKSGRKTIVLAGIESHVCILRTALDALSKGYEVHIALDCVSSMQESDFKIAVERFKQAGVFLASSEMLLFQLLDNSKDAKFRSLSEIVKKYA